MPDLFPAATLLLEFEDADSVAPPLVALAVVLDAVRRAVDELVLTPLLLTGVRTPASVRMLLLYPLLGLEDDIVLRKPVELLCP